MSHVGEVSIFCPESQKALWTALGTMKVMCYTGKASARKIAKEIAGITRALVWEPGPAAEACARAGVSEIIGLPAPKLAKFLTTKLERTVVPGPTEHRVQCMLETVELMGANPLQGEFFQPIPTSIERHPECLLIVPESDYGLNHEWNTDKWIEVIAWVKGQGWEIRIGKLRQGGLSEELAKRSDCETLDLDLSDPNSYVPYPLCLSADGSLPHLAGAFGALCAVLFGPGDPLLTRPLSQRHIIIRQKVECAPCFLSKCPIDLRCQNDLGVDRVIDMLKSLSPA